MDLGSMRARCIHDRTCMEGSLGCLDLPEAIGLFRERLGLAGCKDGGAVSLSNLSLCNRQKERVDDPCGRRPERAHSLI